jgi:hypothetical protein
MNPVPWADLLKWFNVPGYRNVYVLGSFARHVTLYSQQVRALNLIAALVQENIISNGREVVVIGGGAAGLTAAAGAAAHGADVWVLEELEELMELQRNNRQRWLHPYIYDWPDMESQEPEADLPLLRWSAGYAEQVAIMIENEWKKLEPKYPFKVRLGVTNVGITPGEKGVTVTWHEVLENGRRPNPVVILAVGFGLEPQNDYQDSYWAEDNIDSNFRATPQRPEWLVSGFGDGAFSDLMRLCIRRFRHAEIANLFATAPGIDDIKQQLRDMHCGNDQSPEFLTKSFDQLPLGPLVKILKERQRQTGPEVFLTGNDAFLYGPKASILNRLVVCVLDKMGAFRFLPGPVKPDEIQPSKTKRGFDVLLGNGRPRYFDRVILRHGPKPSKLENSFNSIWKACGGHDESGLYKFWKDLAIQKDVTRKQLWPNGFFGKGTPILVAPLVAAEDTFVVAAQRLPAQASTMLVYKELRNDGISTVKYEIKNLAILSGELVGIRFHYESTFGQYGSPQLDDASLRAGFHWEKDPEPVASESKVDFEVVLHASTERGRKLVRNLLFPAPLKPGDPPLSLGLSVTVLNGDAFSGWEFEQLYAPEERVHVNGEPFQYATEYMARVVWFPVENLKLRLTLPSRTPGPPFPNVFLTEDSTIPGEEVVRDKLLQMYPPAGSPWVLPSRSWHKQAPEASGAAVQFANVSAQTWELSVSRPPVGSCYSLDWQLPSSSGKVADLKIEKETQGFQRQLLDYRRLRLTGGGHEIIRRLFLELYAKIAAKYKQQDSDEHFALSMLTYDMDDRKLRRVDGVLNGGEPTQDMWDFWLPFGSGLSGACFKQQDNDPFIYFAPQSGEERSGPESYLPLADRDQHTVLLAVPLSHPEFKDSDATSSFESARLRIAVVDIGSNCLRTKLADFRGEDRDERFRELVTWCGEFRDRLCGVLKATRGTR